MRIASAPRTVLFTALAAALGCGESDAPPGPRAQDTDSAGISIVTSPPVDAVYARLAEQPALTVGEADGAEEFLFGRIASVARDGEGNLVVADGRAGEIRVFDALGRHVRTFGRRGEGPGEFGVLGGAWPATDGGVAAVDRRTGRVTRFDAEGALIGTARFSGVGETAGLEAMGMAGPEVVVSRMTDLGMPPDDEAAMQDLHETLKDEGEPVLFLRHGVDGGLIDTLARRRGRRSVSSMTEEGGMAMVQVLRVPFSRQPSAAGSTGEIAITGGGEYEVVLFGEDGVPRRIVRLGEAPPLRTDAHLDAFVRNSGNPFLTDDASIRAMVEMYQGLPLPERLPGYTGLLFADTGELWARRYRLPGGESTHWDVFGANGHHLGRVEVPTSFRIQEVSRGQVVGIATDELGVERVEVRDLDPVGG